MIANVNEKQKEREREKRGHMTAMREERFIIGADRKYARDMGTGKRSRGKIVTVVVVVVVVLHLQATAVCA